MGCLSRVYQFPMALQKAGCLLFSPVLFHCLPVFFVPTLGSRQDIVFVMAPREAL